MDDAQTLLTKAAVAEMKQWLLMSGVAKPLGMFRPDEWEALASAGISGYIMAKHNIGSAERTADETVIPSSPLISV